MGGSIVDDLQTQAVVGKTTSMRALRAAVHRRHRGTVLVLAPTGKAVDVALREGAGDQGYTIAKAVQLLRDKRLEVGPHTLVIVDEAAMVGTENLRQLLTATTSAGAKTVLVGDQHQLAPVKARGGMFAQLCADLPWTQHLSEVWRMRDPDERAASLGLRDGGSASVRRAIGWYQRHDRLRCGDAVTMAADALTAYCADIDADRNALLVCDTTEVADALNTRLHRERIGADSTTLRGARGHGIAVGDLIMTRRNDPTIALRSPNGSAGQPDAVRNGNRWRVAGIDPAANRVAAERLDDGARTVLGGDYLREHVVLGYALTVHSAQGATADTTHAVIGESADRSLFYVAMTRGRHANTAYFYQRAAEPDSWAVAQDGVHVPVRGNDRDAADLARAILGRDDRPATAHQIAASTAHHTLPDIVAQLVDQRISGLQRRRTAYNSWRTTATQFAAAAERARAADRSRDRGQESEIEL